MSAAKRVVDSTGIPVGICGWSEGGTSMLQGTRYWTKRNASNPFDTSTLYGKLITSMRRVNANNVVMCQGEADYQLTTTQYLDSARKMFANIQTDLGYMPYIYIVQTREIGGVSGDLVTDMVLWLTIPPAHDSLCNDTSIFKAASTYPNTTWDGAHYDSTCQWRTGKLIGDVIVRKLLGTISSGYRFKITSVDTIANGILRVQTSVPAGKRIAKVPPDLFCYTDDLHIKSPLVVSSIDSATIYFAFPGRRTAGTLSVWYDRYRFTNFGRGPAAYTNDSIPLEARR
jgi:hypothetical protein